MPPSSDLQFQPMELVVTPGLHGARIGYTDGLSIRYIEDPCDVGVGRRDLGQALAFPTLVPARKAYEAALSAMDWYKRRRVE